MSKRNEKLWGATRQFRHNTDNSPDYENPKMGFVIAYDSAEVDAVVAELEAQLKESKHSLTQVRARVDELINQRDNFSDKYQKALVEVQKCWLKSSLAMEKK